MILMRVDLPAPLSPTSPTTSPEYTSKSTFCNACTVPNAFETPFNWRVGVADATAPGEPAPPGAPEAFTAIKPSPTAACGVGGTHRHREGHQSDHAAITPRSPGNDRDQMRIG